jgi:hypothetical protein
MISSFKQNEVVLQHNGLCFLQDSIFTSDAIEKTTILFSRVDTTGYSTTQASV